MKIATTRPAALLSRQMTAEAAFVCLLDHCAQQFVAELPHLMLFDDAEGSHRTRVALRRLRSVLDGFRPILKRAAIDGVKAEAKGLFRLIGLLRDAEIACELAKTAGTDGDAKTLEAMRGTIRSALMALDAPGFAKRTHKWLTGKTWHRAGHSARDWRKGPVKALAAVALVEAWRTCTAYGPDLAALAPDTRHSFRKDLKTLRYLGDFFIPLWQTRSTKAFVSTMKALQEELGILTDVAVLRTLTSPDQDVERELDFKVVAALTKADHLWRKLAGQPVWWR